MSLLVGLIGVGCVVAVLGLAFRGEVAFARGTPTETRLWLINDGGNQGLAFSRGNVFENDAASGEICARTRVRFLLWRSSEPSENVEYCECFRQEGGRYQLIGTCEP